MSVTQASAKCSGDPIIPTDERASGKSADLDAPDTKTKQQNKATPHSVVCDPDSKPLDSQQSVAIDEKSSIVPELHVSQVEGTEEDKPRLEIGGKAAEKRCNTQADVPNMQTIERNETSCGYKENESENEEMNNIKLETINYGGMHESSLEVRGQKHFVENLLGMANSVSDDKVNVVRGNSESESLSSHLEKESVYEKYYIQAKGFRLLNSKHDSEEEAEGSGNKLLEHIQKDDGSEMQLSEETTISRNGDIRCDGNKKTHMSPEQQHGYESHTHGVTSSTNAAAEDNSDKHKLQLQPESESVNQNARHPVMDHGIPDDIPDIQDDEVDDFDFVAAQDVTEEVALPVVGASTGGNTPVDAYAAAVSVLASASVSPSPAQPGSSQAAAVESALATLASVAHASSTPGRHAPHPVRQNLVSSLRTETFDLIGQGFTNTLSNASSGNERDINVDESPGSSCGPSIAMGSRLKSEEEAVVNEEFGQSGSSQSYTNADNSSVDESLPISTSVAKVVYSGSRRERPVDEVNTDTDVADENVVNPANNDDNAPIMVHIDMRQGYVRRNYDDKASTSTDSNFKPNLNSIEFSQQSVNTPPPSVVTTGSNSNSIVFMNDNQGNEKDDNDDDEDNDLDVDTIQDFVEHDFDSISVSDERETIIGRKDRTEKEADKLLDQVILGLPESGFGPTVCPDMEGDSEPPSSELVEAQVTFSDTPSVMEQWPKERDSSSHNVSVHVYSDGSPAVGNDQKKATDATAQITECCLHAAEVNNLSEDVFEFSLSSNTPAIGSGASNTSLSLDNAIQTVFTYNKEVEETVPPEKSESKESSQDCQCVIHSLRSTEGVCEESKRTCVGLSFDSSNMTFCEDMNDASDSSAQKFSDIASKAKHIACADGQQMENEVNDVSTSFLPMTPTPNEKLAMVPENITQQLELNIKEYGDVNEMYDPGDLSIKQGENIDSKGKTADMYTRASKQNVPDNDDLVNEELKFTHHSPSPRVVICQQHENKTSGRATLSQNIDSVLPDPLSHGDTNAIEKDVDKSTSSPTLECNVQFIGVINNELGANDPFILPLESEFVTQYDGISCKDGEVDGIPGNNLQQLECQQERQTKEFKVCKEEEIRNDDMSCECFDPNKNKCIAGNETVASLERNTELSNEDTINKNCENVIDYGTNEECIELHALEPNESTCDVMNTRHVCQHSQDDKRRALSATYGLEDGACEDILRLVQVPNEKCSKSEEKKCLDEVSFELNTPLREGESARQGVNLQEQDHSSGFNRKFQTIEAVKGFICTAEDYTSKESGSKTWEGLRHLSEVQKTHSDKREDQSDKSRTESEIIKQNDHTDADNCSDFENMITDHSDMCPKTETFLKMKHSNTDSKVNAQELVTEVQTECLIKREELGGNGNHKEKELEGVSEGLESVRENMSEIDNVRKNTGEDYSGKDNDEYKRELHGRVSKDSSYTDNNLELTKMEKGVNKPPSITVNEESKPENVETGLTIIDPGTKHENCKREQNSEGLKDHLDTSIVGDAQEISNDLRSDYSEIIDNVRNANKIDMHVRMDHEDESNSSSSFKSDVQVENDFSDTDNVNEIQKLEEYSSKAQSNTDNANNAQSIVRDSEKDFFDDVKESNAQDLRRDHPGTRHGGDAPMMDNDAQLEPSEKGKMTTAVQKNTPEACNYVHTIGNDIDVNEDYFEVNNEKDLDMDVTGNQSDMDQRNAHLNQTCINKGRVLQVSSVGLNNGLMDVVDDEHFEHKVKTHLDYNTEKEADGEHQDYVHQVDGDERQADEKFHKHDEDQSQGMLACMMNESIGTHVKQDLETKGKPMTPEIHRDIQKSNMTPCSLFQTIHDIQELNTDTDNDTKVTESDKEETHTQEKDDENDKSDGKKSILQGIHNAKESHVQMFSNDKERTENATDTSKNEEANGDVNKTKDYMKVEAKDTNDEDYICFQGKEDITEIALRKAFKDVHNVEHEEKSDGGCRINEVIKLASKFHENIQSKVNEANTHFQSACVDGIDDLNEGSSNKPSDCDLQDTVNVQKNKHDNNSVEESLAQDHVLELGESSALTIATNNDHDREYTFCGRKNAVEEKASDDVCEAMQKAAYIPKIHKVTSEDLREDNGKPDRIPNHNLSDAVDKDMNISEKLLVEKNVDADKSFNRTNIKFENELNVSRNKELDTMDVNYKTDEVLMDNVSSMGNETTSDYIETANSPDVIECEQKSDSVRFKERVKPNSPTSLIENLTVSSDSEACNDADSIEGVPLPSLDNPLQAVGKEHASTYSSDGDATPSDVKGKALEEEYESEASVNQFDNESIYTSSSKIHEENVRLLGDKEEALPSYSSATVSLEKSSDAGRISLTPRYDVPAVTNSETSNSQKENVIRKTSNVSLNSESTHASTSSNNHVVEPMTSSEISNTVWDEPCDVPALKSQNNGTKHEPRGTFLQNLECLCNTPAASPTTESSIATSHALSEKGHSAAKSIPSTQRLRSKETPVVKQLPAERTGGSFSTKVNDRVLGTQCQGTKPIAGRPPPANPHQRNAALSAAGSSVKRGKPVGNSLDVNLSPWKESRRPKSPTMSRSGTSLVAPRGARKDVDEPRARGDGAPCSVRSRKTSIGQRSSQALIDRAKTTAPAAPAKKGLQPHPPPCPPPFTKKAVQRKMVPPAPTRTKAKSHNVSLVKPPKRIKDMTVVEFERYNEQKRLLEKLSRIKKSQAVVDCHQDPRNMEQSSRKLKRCNDRIHKNSMLALENLKFLELLQLQKSSYDRNDQLQNFRKNYSMLSQSRVSDSWPLLRGVEKMHLAARRQDSGLHQDRNTREQLLNKRQATVAWAE